MSAAVRFQSDGVGHTRVVRLSPVSRPDLHTPQARPSRRVVPVRVGRASSCLAVRPAPRPSVWLSVRVALVGLVALAGGALAVGQLIADSAPDPSRGYVAGDPAWAHVHP